MRRINRGTPLNEEQLKLKEIAIKASKGTLPSRSAFLEAAEKFNRSLLEDQYRDNALTLNPPMFGREWSN